MKDHLVHFFKEHKKETLYFVLIYCFTMNPLFFTLLMLKKQMSFSYNFLLILILLNSIPLGLYSEYSMRKLGYKKIWFTTLWTYFLVVALTFGIYSNALIDESPAIFFWGLSAGWLLIYVLGFFYVKDDRCSCEGQSKTAP